MAAPNGFGSKKSRKNDQNFPNFFFRKKEYKTSLETQFHQKSLKTRNFSSITARHKKSTVPENGPNSRHIRPNQSQERLIKQSLKGAKSVYKKLIARNNEEF